MSGDVWMMGPSGAAAAGAGRTPRRTSQKENGRHRRCVREGQHVPGGHDMARGGGEGGGATQTGWGGQFAINASEKQKEWDSKECG